MNKRQLIKEIKNLLGLEDFKAIGVGAGAVSLRREHEHTTENIVIAYSKYPGIYILSNSFSGRKSFKKVDKILSKHFNKTGAAYVDHTIHRISKRFESLSKIRIRKSEDLYDVESQLRSMILDDIIPFYSEYDDLKSVNDKLDRLQSSEVAKFIVNPPSPRIMVIKRLVNAPDWEEYCEKKICEFEEYSQGKYKSFFKPIYEFLPDLYEELKTLDIDDLKNTIQQD